MKLKRLLVLMVVGVMLTVLVGSIAGADSNSQNQLLAQEELPDSAGNEVDLVTRSVHSPRNRTVPDVPEAFAQLTNQGEWQGFYPNNAPFVKEICLCQEIDGYGFIDDCMTFCPCEPWDCTPTNKQHFQGITRHGRTDNTFFYVTRAGEPDNDLVATEGALWVVRMGSQLEADHALDGERIGSNRLKEGLETKDTMGNYSASIVSNWISFDEFYEGGVLDYNHPGGLQMVGDIIAVGFEGPNRGVLPAGKVGFFDTSYPEQPDHIGIGKDIYLDHGAAAVGIAWHPIYQRYFVVIGSGGSKKTLEFYKSTGSDFNDPSFHFEHFDTITTAELQLLANTGDYDFEPEPQSLNLIVGENKQVYLIGAANIWDGDPQFDNAAPIVNGANRMWLWEVEFPTSLADQNVRLRAIDKADKGLDSDGDPLLGPCYLIHDNLGKQEANFNAAAGAYVSPTGELLYYATSFWNLGVGRITRMAELRSKYVSHEKTCGPQFRDDHLGGPYRIPEGSDLWLDGRVHIVYPWVHMYNNSDFRPGNNVMMDWQGQFHDDYRDFSKLDGEDGFKDDMSSFRFCGPAGSTLEIFDATPPDGQSYEEGWESAKGGNDGWLQCEGTGEVIEVPNLSQLGDHCRHLDSEDSDDFDGDADSARLLMDNPTFEWRVEGGGGGSLEDLNAYEVIFHARGGPANNTVWFDLMGVAVKAEIEVYNVVPEIVSFVIDPELLNEGQEIALDATWRDHGDPVVEATVFWGDGLKSEKTAECHDCSGPYSGPIDFVHVYADNGDYQVTLCFDDDITDELEATCESQEVQVKNVIPRVEAGTDQNVDEGELLLLNSATFNDAGFDCSTCDPFTEENFVATVYWGDGTTEPPAGITLKETPGSEGVVTTGTVQAGHYYADNGDYTVTVCVQDDDLDSSCASFDVSVANVVPDLAIGGNQTIYEGDVLKLDPSTFSDPGFDCPLCDPETWEDFTASVDWGDGRKEPPGGITLKETPGSESIMTTGTIAASHQYVDPPGRYEVEVCLWDDEMVKAGDAGVCESLTVTVVHGFMRFCAYADGVKHDLTMHKQAAAACQSSFAGIPGERRDSGLGSRGDVDINEAATVEGILLSLEEKVDVGKEVVVLGMVTAGHDVKVEKEAVLQSSIVAGHRVDIKKDAAVHGDVTAANRIKIDARATILGAVNDYTPVLPIPAISWVEFAVETGTENVTLRKGAAYTLVPGSYRDLKVGSGAVLTLQAGTYDFREITVEKEATLIFDLSGDPGTAVINIADQLTMKQDVQMAILAGSDGLPSGEATDILFRVANLREGKGKSRGLGGSFKLYSGGTYLGTYLAPGGFVQLGRGAALEGALYGEKVTIEQGARIIGAPALDVFVEMFVNP